MDQETDQNHMDGTRVKIISNENCKLDLGLYDFRVQIYVSKIIQIFQIHFFIMRLGKELLWLTFFDNFHVWSPFLLKIGPIYFGQLHTPRFQKTLFLNLVTFKGKNVPNFVYTKGAFTNYVDKIVAFSDHIPSSVDIFYGINVAKNKFFWPPTHLLWHFLWYDRNKKWTF